MATYQVLSEKNSHYITIKVLFENYSFEQTLTIDKSKLESTLQEYVDDYETKFLNNLE